MSGTDFSCLPVDDAKNWLASFDTILVDCDGVLWLHDKVIPGAPETLNRFLELGKKIFYVTNNSTKTRDEFVAKCTRLGFKATKENILSTAYLTAGYLEDLGFKKKAYIVGSEGIAKELDLVGIKSLGVGPDTIATGDLGTVIYKQLAMDPEVGAVVIGFDVHFNFMKMLKAASYANNPDCIFVATNTDERFPMDAENVVVPGTGSIVAAVETCAGRQAFKIGKPSAYICEALMKRHCVDPEKTLMIGDRCNTDILFGKRCGFATMLVLTGVTRLHEVEAWRRSSLPEERELVPDHHVCQLGDLLQYLA
ncbi:glycerol-3-phosphate phosphatase [Bacillus rossius redtenbacheri]|uniref:glycerol-3-phosphate phosphatase n=1 Tax=Bacillus rossius redtenbacheri TaxID=93214 RepID=UPI002FDE902E